MNLRLRCETMVAVGLCVLFNSHINFNAHFVRLKLRFIDVFKSWKIGI